MEDSKIKTYIRYHVVDPSEQYSDKIFTTLEKAKHEIKYQKTRKDLGEYNEHWNNYPFRIEEVITVRRPVEIK